MLSPNGDIGEAQHDPCRCESLWVLLPYVEWDRFITLAGSKSGLRVMLSYLSVSVHVPHDVVAEQLSPNPQMACDLGQLGSIIKDMSTLHNFQIKVLKGI